MVHSQRFAYRIDFLGTLRDEVDQSTACPEVGKADLGTMPFQFQAEHRGVEVNRSPQIAHPECEMIDADHWPGLAAHDHRASVHVRLPLI